MADNRDAPATDTLGSLLESPTATRPVPPRRRPPGRLRVGRLALVLGVLAALVAGLIYGVGAVLSRLTASTPDYAGAGHGQQVICIKPGETVGQLASDLAQNDVVKSSAAFREAAAKDNTRASQIQPVCYQLRKQMSAQAAFDLLFDPSAQAALSFTIPEGDDIRQMLPIISKATHLSVQDLEAAANNPDALGLPSWAQGVKNAEGFLFPATYPVKPGASAVDVLRAMVARFNQEAETLNLAAVARSRGITPLQAVTLASIVEREVNQTADRSKAAAVLYNRLDNTSEFPTLGMDSTVRYALGDYMGPLTQSQLNVDSPYNTRRYAGIPPGPIGNPGRASLDAVLHPDSGSETFFVYLPKENRTVFTADPAEFARLERQYRDETGGG